MRSSSPPLALVDHPLLADLLEPILGPDAANRIARSLLIRFGSLGGVFTAPEERLQPLLGEDSRRVAAFLSTLRRALVGTMRRRLEHRPVLGCHSRLVSYLKTMLAHETTEHLRVLYLDVANHLILDELTGVGTLNHAPVYPREIVRRALDVGAKNLILVHNHPSGDTTPSRADVASTRRIAASAAVFEIQLLDHYVVGRNDVRSMKALGLLYFGELYVDYEPRGSGTAVVRTLTGDASVTARKPRRGAGASAEPERLSP